MPAARVQTENEHDLAGTEDLEAAKEVITAITTTLQA